MNHSDERQYFQRRRRQAISLGLGAALLLSGVAVARFHADLAAAEREQEWGLYRDDHCTQVAGPKPRKIATAYDHAHSEGSPGTWSCKDGKTYVLSNSDKPPATWQPSATDE